AARDAYASRVTDDEIRSLVAELPDAGDLLQAPRGYAVRSRPDTGTAEAAGTTVKDVDAWVVANRGQLRTARAQASGGVRPGRRVAPPPSAPQRVYVLPADVLAD
ncbi:MAG: hypothetical protein QOJ82_2927, partial [Solirubrobacteraceae bacterium]|nr:hypothetical protein [Solirubrobacteraceae bacterium]